MPSSFIGEIPAQFIEEIRPKTNYSANHNFSQQTNYSYAQQSNDSGLTIGQRVLHQKFGEGFILNYEGQGKSARVEVNFDQVGSKWLVLSYANLQTL